MKKIMFNDRYGLTKAVLEGRKTQTRRFLTTAPDRYKLGEIVAVAQSYGKAGIPYGQIVEYVADPILNRYGARIAGTSAGWNNKMFTRADLMPHQIKITNVRKELLGDITTEDIIKEGILQTNEGLFTFVGNEVGEFLTARCCFNAFIDKVFGKGTWLSNPLVTVYEFELVK